MLDDRAPRVSYGREATHRHTHAFSTKKRTPAKRYTQTHKKDMRRVHSTMHVMLVA